MIHHRRFARSLGVCSECGHHHPVTAADRVEQLLDRGSATPVETPKVLPDPLSFVDSVPYAERLASARETTGLAEAAVCVRGLLHGRPVVLVVMDFRFLGGSLGSAVGELVTVAAEIAERERRPLITVTASGGARMQEGVLSLMQMAKTSQAFAALDEAGVMSVSVVADPTFGGVAASFATLADVILIEPGARMGFAGPRVIRQTIREELPEGFQTAEFLLEHGMVDAVVPRHELRGVLSRLVGGEDHRPPPRPPAYVPRKRDAWEVVRLARDTRRPTTADYAGLLLEDFQELRGDRVFGDSRSVFAGMGRLGGVPLMLIGHQKGHNTAELVASNFGMPQPEGYRKAARLMRLAEKLRLPVVTLVDTPGAYPGVTAEERGQATAIAESQRLMARLTVPVVSVVTGEGGSGGALALAVANRVLICANAWYSVISPEGCASILWKTPAAAPEAARALRLEAEELLRLGVVDGVVPEPEGGAHTDPVLAARMLGAAIHAALAELLPLSPTELIRQRYGRFRHFGLPVTRAPLAVALGGDRA
ncbi:hypothetical protein GCM10027161_56870 [Microbispora hainanensis]